MVNTGIEVLAHRDPAQRNLSALEEANFRGKSPVAGAYRAASYRGDFKRPTWADRWEPGSGRPRLNCLCSAAPFDGRIVRLREADRVLALRSALIARGVSRGRHHATLGGRHSSVLPARE